MPISAGSIPCPPYIQDQEQHRKAITNWMMRVSPFVTTDSTSFVTENDVSAAIAAAVGTVAGWIPASRFNVAGDTRRMSTVLTITSGTAALTVPSASFTAGDVGKSMTMNWNDALGTFTSTILSVNSLTSIGLSTNCTRTLSAAPGIVTVGTDDRSAMQAAIAYCQGSGSGATLFVKAGWYTFGGMLSVASTMSIVGDGWKGLRSIAGTTTLDWATSPAFGTVFYPNFMDSAGGSACIKVLAHNVCLKDFEIETVQPLPGTLWNYTTSPWNIKAFRNGFDAEGGDDMHLENIMLRNPTKGIRTQGCSRGYMHGIYGQPFVFGIYVSGCYDVPRFEDVHFWPFYSLTPQVMSAQAVLADALTFGRVDGPMLTNIFGYHMRSLVRCFNSDEVDIAVDGFTERGFGTNLYADDCQWGLFIQDNASFDITNFQIYCSTVSGSRAIYATSRIGQDSILRLSIANLDIQAPMLEAIKLEVAAQVNLTNFRLRSCNLSNVGAVVIDLTRTSTCNLVNFVDENAHFSSSLFAVGSSVTVNWARGQDDVGNMTLSGNLSVAGNLSVSTITALGSLNIRGALSVSGATVLAAATMTNATVGGTLSVSGAAVCKGALSIGGITNAGNVNAASLSCAGGLQLSGGLGVSGGAVIGGNTFVGGTFTAVGQSIFGDAIIAQNMPGPFSTDASAAAAGIAVGRFYRNGSTLMIRVT